MVIRVRQPLLVWAPRMLGLAFSLFLALFALDAFSEGETTAERVVVHLLPSLVVVALVAASWHHEWIGAVTFAILGLAYARTTVPGHIDWMLLISGPLMLLSSLFLWNWLTHRGEGPSHSAANRL